MMTPDRDLVAESYPGNHPGKNQEANMASGEKLVLSENHRRVVSALLRRVEATCDEVLDCMVRPGGNLRQISEDVSERQAGELRSLVERLRREIERVENEMAVDPSRQPRSRCIVSSVSLTRVELEEALTPGLRGYGALSPDLEAALDAKFARLLACLYAMSSVLERGGSRSAP
jgi:hypothetical protein